MSLGQMFVDQMVFDQMLSTKCFLSKGDQSEWSPNEKKRWLKIHFLKFYELNNPLNLNFLVRAKVALADVRSTL